MPLAGTVALVTGGARRVGKAIALALADRGADIVVHYNSGAIEADETAAEIRTRGVRVATVQGDLAQVAVARALPQQAHALLGRLDIVINSAAMMLRTPIGDVMPDEWDRMFALNLRAPFFVAQAAAPLMLAAGGVMVMSAGNTAATGLSENPADRPGMYSGQVVCAPAATVHKKHVIARSSFMMLPFSGQGPVYWSTN